MQKNENLEHFMSYNICNSSFISEKPHGHFDRLNDFEKELMEAVRHSVSTIGGATHTIGIRLAIFRRSVEVIFDSKLFLK